ncbi:MAG: YceI family protein [Pseudohongiellaceae bacterium]|jgi:polyisoprenoid-binding protein YceI
MKPGTINSKIFAIVANLTLITLLSSAANAEPSDWEIDAEHFSIMFAVEHIGYQQQIGMFLDASGSFRYDPQTNELFSGQVEVAANSVFSNHEERDQHLRGGDFLDAGDHSLVVFNATEFTPDRNNSMTGTLTGNLTLLGETHPVQMQVTLNKRERYPFGHRQETLGISASTTIQRSQWGMDYGVSNNLVGDAVDLRFEFEAIRQ